MLLLSVQGNIAYSQDFTISVKNLVQTAANRIEFDVYLLDTDGSEPFELASSQLGFLFNSLIYTGGSVSVAIDNTDTGLNSSQQFTASPTVENNLSGYPDQTLIRLAGRTPPGAGNGTIISAAGDGTLMTHFVITSTVNFTVSSTPDLTFCSSTVSNPLYPTRVNEYVGTVNTSWTVTSGTNAIVEDNPVLNPPPEAFEVTGTGSYCEGTTGIPVGLSGSETGVTYTLYRNSISLGQTVDGTGAAVSFGDQTEGTYTVSGTNSYGTTDMTGDAVISELAAPLSPKHTIDCSSGAGNAVVTLTDPIGSGLEYSLDGGAYQSSTSFSNVANGSHSITVRNSSGCETTGPAFDVSCSCSDPPVLSLSSTTGSTCGTESVTVGDNTFGGSATAVTITHNGSGTVSPSLAGISPFSFTYTPAAGDAGATVVITVTTDNPLGSPCEEASGTYSLTVNPLPAAPLIGIITQPTCETATGSVVLNGLPSSGTWTLTRSPDNVSISGTGTSATVSSLNPGTYSFTVTNAGGCTSVSSSDVTINSQPPTPSAPVIGTITAPSCNVSTGSVVLEDLPSSGTWIITRSPGGVITSGTGESTTVSSIPSGSYTFTVTNSAGCTSEPSSEVVMPEQPPTPGAPLIGTITQPTCAIPTGSVILEGLPSGGTWTITRFPGEISTTGTGTSTTISGLTANTYNFTVTSEDGCVSSLSDDVVIEAPPAVPAAPEVGAVTQPTCDLATGSVVLNGLPSGGTWILTRNPGGVITTGSGSSITISGLPPGTYTYTVSNGDGCTSEPSAQIVINEQPPTPSAPESGLITHPTCDEASGSVVLNGLPGTGSWTIAIIQSGATVSGSGTSATITGLAPGDYSFTVTNSEGCTSPPSETVTINAQPPSPSAPEQSVDCSPGAGNAVVTVTSPLGSSLLYSLDGGSYQSDPSFSGVANGTHIITVQNSYGCTTTGSSFSVSCDCANPPAVTLSSTSGTVCGISPLTVSENTFGGSASSVTITADGAGTVSPSASSVSPFSFTYTPVASDAGTLVTITVSTDNPLGAPCSEATANYSLTVGNIPEIPSIGTVTHPTCAEPGGSVVLNDLPSSGSWLVTVSPGGLTTGGTGTSTTITGLTPGTYTFSVTNSAGCISQESEEVVIYEQPATPAAPIIGEITQTSCSSSTGSVVLNGLPSEGTWTVTRTPGSVSVTDTGTSTTFTNLLAGSYTFTVSNSSGCTSPPSEEIVINEQPETPSQPSVGEITAPTCSESTGSVNLFGLPSSGTWTIIRYPGTIETSGTGSSITISGLEPGTYNYTVSNEAGCVSVPSSNIVIPAQPPTPSAPVIGTVSQPTFEVPTGSVMLGGLPSSGTWTIIRNPGDVITTGTGTSTIITGLEPGVFTFRVTNSYGCTSARSEELIISTPGVPTLIINDPEPVCYPETVDLTAEEITEGSTPGLSFTYWEDSNATIEYQTPGQATEGTYYILGTTVSGYFNIKPVVVTVVHQPVANAGPDQVLNYKFETELHAELDSGLMGTWHVLKGSGNVRNDTLPVTTVSGLSLNENVLLWTVTNGVCPASRDSLIITVNDLIIPTLITPNLDGRNDYFVLRGIETLGRTELIIFDRRGALVYENPDYDNSWDGVDQKGNPIPDDTYFYTIIPETGKAFKGYIVIQR